MGRSLEGFRTRKPPRLAGSTAVAVPRSGPQPEETWTDELQRLAGNQAVTRLLHARDAASPPTPHLGRALKSGDVVAPPLVHRVVRSPGVPLDPDVAAATRVGIPADVRVHADEEAARSADAVHARAYAVGRHVVFARGQYDPASARGRSLLEHELTHVAQQGGGEAGGTIRVAPRDDFSERQARQSEVTGSGAVANTSNSASTAVRLQRSPQGGHDTCPTGACHSGSHTRPDQITTDAGRAFNPGSTTGSQELNIMAYLPDEESQEFAGYLLHGFTRMHWHNRTLETVKPVMHTSFPVGSEILGYVLYYGPVAKGSRDESDPENRPGGRYVVISRYGDEVEVQAFNYGIESEGLGPLEYILPSGIVSALENAVARRVASLAMRGASYVGSRIVRPGLSAVNRKMLRPALTSLALAGEAGPTAFSGMASRTGVELVEKRATAAAGQGIATRLEGTTAAVGQGGAARLEAQVLSSTAPTTQQAAQQASARASSVAPAPSYFGTTLTFQSLSSSRSTAAAAADALSSGLADVQAGRLGVQAHNRAPSVRRATGLAGFESAHAVAQAVGRQIPGYSAGRALTVLLPHDVHRAFDSGWVSVWNTAVAQGRQMTALEVRDMFLRAVDAIPEILLPRAAKNTLAWKIVHELFSVLGLSPSDIILP